MHPVSPYIKFTVLVSGEATLYLPLFRGRGCDIRTDRRIVNLYWTFYNPLDPSLTLDCNTSVALTQTRVHYGV